MRELVHGHRGGAIGNNGANGANNGAYIPWMRAPADQVVADRDEWVGELTLLGGFRLVCEDLVEVSATGQRVIAAVACQSSTAVRTKIAHLLWPDTTSERAHANLRTAVYRLEHSCPGLLEVGSSYLRLAPGISVDVARTSALATSIVANDGPLPPALVEEAMEANLQDDLLPDWDEEWLVQDQLRYRQLRLTTLERLSERLVEGGQHGVAVHTALAAVQADSLRDSAHQTLIRACLAQGNRYEALTHFETYQRIVRDELGIEPAETIGQFLCSA